MRILPRSSFARARTATFFSLFQFLISPFNNADLSVLKRAATISPAAFPRSRLFIVLFHETKSSRTDATGFSHTPRSRRQDHNSTSRWAGVLEQARTSRVGSKRSMALASAFGVALLLPTTLSTQSKAQPERSAIKIVRDLVPVTSIVPLPSQTMHVVAVVAGKTQKAEVEIAPRQTVGSVLKALGVLVGPLDRVSPVASSPAQDGMTIKVTQVASRLSKKYVSVPAQLLYRPTTLIHAGATQQIQAPREGKIEIIERVWSLDGHETSREFVSKRLALAPLPRIIALGARSNVLPANVRPHKRYAMARGYVNSFRGGSPRDRALGLAANQSSDLSSLRPLKCIEGVVTTGYAAGRAGGAVSSWTATGVRCTYGAVAVDPRLIPLGSTLYIEGYGYGFACDTGGAIKGKHIDLAFDSARAAFAHGKRRTRVWILGR